MSMKLPLQDCSSWLASSRQAFRGRFYSATHVIQIYLSQLNQCLHITVAAQLASPASVGLLQLTRLLMVGFTGQMPFEAGSHPSFQPFV